MIHPAPKLLALLLLPFLGACSGLGRAPLPEPPLPGLENVDDLIEEGERHFAHLWRVTRGGENAEGYWSFAGDRLVLQRKAEGWDCDRIFVTDGAGGLTQVSSGRGTTTCSYFLPDDRHVVFGSTQGGMEDCPPPTDRSDGYVWPIHPEFDLWVKDLETGEERAITTTPGYDAEATVSPTGDRMVFTSTRSGDLELWTCNLDGSDVRQVTDSLGYDGGAFFSHDGTKLVFRATRFAPDGQTGDRAQYVDLLAKHKIRPHKLDIFVCDVDGSNRVRLTDLDGASWAPYFYPDDRRVMFSSNHHDENTPQVEFDLFAVDLDGGDLEQITTYAGFDSFPMFSPDGRYLVFGSNRGGSEPGETNLYIAEWR